MLNNLIKKKLVNEIRGMTGNSTNSTNGGSLECKSASLNRKWNSLDILLGILFIVSLIGNSIVIVVMRNVHMRRKKTALFVTSIAVADIFVLFFKFLTTVFRIYKVKIFSKACIFVQIIPEIAALVSYWLIITTTFERYFAVLYPLEVVIIFARRRCCMIIVFIVLFFIILVNTRTLCSEFISEKNIFCPMKAYKNEVCSLYVNYVYPWIKSAFVSWFPSIIGIILNGRIIMELFKASKNRRVISHLNTLNSARMKENEKRHAELFLNFTKLNDSNLKNKSKSKEKQITIMLCTISVTFLLFTLPYTICEILRKMSSNMRVLIDRYAQRVIMFPLDLLHSCNFVLYYLSSQQFRSALFKIFTKFLKKRDQKNFNVINILSSTKK